jgi:hypothetical protein
MRMHLYTEVQKVLAMRESAIELEVDDQWVILHTAQVPQGRESFGNA